MGGGEGVKGVPEEGFGLRALKGFILTWLAIGVLFLGFFGFYIKSKERLLGRERLLKAISKVIPSADPGVVNSARYIRHYSITYPTSAFPDFPAEIDYLPSGMFFPPYTKNLGGFK